MKTALVVVAGVLGVSISKPVQAEEGADPVEVAYRHGGLVLRLEPGLAVWNLDAAKVKSQVGADAPNVDSEFVGQVQNGFGLAFSLGYNILGHATLAAEVTGTGWDIGSIDRGGGGFVAGVAAWHPLALVDRLSEPAHRALKDFDTSLFFGAGYGVVGEKRAADGLHFETGLRVEYFVHRFVSLGLALRYYPLAFDRYVVDWSINDFATLPSGSGGSLLLPAATIALHAPLGP